MMTLLNEKNILSLTAKQQWPQNIGFIHCSALSIKHSLLQSLTIISVGAWFSWLAFLLGTLTALLLLCILNLLIMFVSSRKQQINLQMIIQEYYLVSTQDNIIGSGNKACPFLTLTFQGQNLSVWSGVHPDNPWGLVFEPASNISSLTVELDLHASMMYCNISEIIPGPTFGQQKHKIIDSCKRDFNITFPVRPL